MVLTHSLIGVPITYFVLKSKSQDLKNKISLNIAYCLGIIGSVFPDFDLTLRFFVHDLEHRKLVSHSVVPYLLLFIFIYFLSNIFKKNKDTLKIYNLIFFCSVVSHLFFDFLVGGISLFAPINPNTFGFEIYFEKTSNFFYNYFTSWYMFFELMLILFSLYFINKLKSNWVVLFLPLIFFFIALIMSITY